MRKIALALLLLLVAPALAAQSARLVKDINATINRDATSSGPKDFFRYGSRIYFAAHTPSTGVELWSTDGTEAGTAMVANIYPGTTASSPSRFAVVNDRLLFNARGPQGEELWVTDGTSAGTRVLADISPGGSSSPGDRIVYGSRMFFAASESVYGRELWVTDGTPGGTRFFKDLAPGPDDSYPDSFVPFNGAVYFAAGNGLWKTDGTESGTVAVETTVAPLTLVVAGSRLFFNRYGSPGGYELWVSDGTAAGTQQIAGVTVASYTLTPFGDRVLFLGTDPEHGSEWWISDGTAAGTRMLRDIAPGPANGSTGFGIIVNGTSALFAATSPEAGVELWKSDGSPAGTTLLGDLVPGTGSSSPAGFVNAGSLVYFVTSGPYVSTYRAQMWVTDGTAGGTRPVTAPDARFAIGSALTNIDGTLYFAGADSLHGFEPWRSDGTAEGTRMVANLATDAAPSSAPRHFTAAADWIYFDAWDGTAPPAASSRSEGYSFWRSDGTPEGTVKLLDETVGYENVVRVGRSLFFTGYDYARYDYALWFTDGTPEGTKPATELEKRFPEPPHISYVLGDKIIVTSDDEVWATTLAPGSPAVRLGAEAGSIGSLAEVAGRLLFVSDDVLNADAVLYSTDGTPEGTYVVREFADTPGGLTAMGGSVYFTTAGDDATKLWRTDGTADGTAVVTTLPEGAYQRFAAGSNLFFLDRRGGLWVSNGTAAGTRALPATPVEGRVVVIGDKVVFAASDPATGTELWVSDGTPEGTHLLYEIGPGISSAYVNELTGAGGVAYFNASQADTGSELWITDGTAAGTKLVADIEPGQNSGYPVQLTSAGEQLFFSAGTSATGRELWAATVPGPRLRIADARLPEPAAGAAAMRFTVTLSAASAQNVTVQYATSNGTASDGSDYDPASGTLTFAAGETVKTIDVPVRGDAAVENDETFLVTLRNPAGAILETTVAAGIIEDSSRTADVGLALDFSSLAFNAVLVDVTNAGPSTATNLRAFLTATPVNHQPGGCWHCPFVQLAPNAKERAFAFGEFGPQKYLTATVSARERDPNAANNTVAWTMKDFIAMDALSLTPGSQANIWIPAYQAGTVSVESSDPSVVTVPSSVAIPTAGTPVSFAVHGVRVGTANVRVFTPTTTIGTLAVDVLAPGAKRRWPGAIGQWEDAGYLPYTSDVGFTIYAQATAPFTGETATGLVTVKANGRELGRVNLTPDVHSGRVAFYAPEIGTNTIAIEYEGDANFLPMTLTRDITLTPGYTTITATATRNGTDVVVRTLLEGSPMAAPTGTIRLGDATANTPLTTTGPGLARAEVTLHDVPANTNTLTIRYSGDPHYNPSQQQVRITDDRRRTTRH